MLKPKHFPPEGIVLVSMLALLTLLIVISLAAAQRSALSAHISHNSKNQSLAMQAAEAALSSAASRLAQVGSFMAPALGADCLILAGQKFVVAASSYKAIWRQSDVWTTAVNSLLPCGVPVYSVSFDWPKVTATAKYMMEYMTVFVLPPTAEQAAIGAQTRRAIFRITALGFGVKTQNAVKIQALYSKDFAVDGSSLTTLKRLAWRQVID